MEEITEDKKYFDGDLQTEPWFGYEGSFFKL